MIQECWCQIDVRWYIAQRFLPFTVQSIYSSEEEPKTIILGSMLFLLFMFIPTNVQYGWICIWIFNRHFFYWALNFVILIQQIKCHKCYLPKMLGVLLCCALLLCPLKNDSKFAQVVERWLTPPNPPLKWTQGSFKCHPQATASPGVQETVFNLSAWNTLSVFAKLYSQGLCKQNK